MNAIRDNIYTGFGRFSLIATMADMRQRMERGELEQSRFETINSILMDLQIIDNLMEQDDIIDNPNGVS